MRAGVSPPPPPPLLLPPPRFQHDDNTSRTRGPPPPQKARPTQVSRGLCHQRRKERRIQRRSSIGCWAGRESDADSEWRLVSGGGAPPGTRSQ